MTISPSDSSIPPGAQTNAMEATIPEPSTKSPNQVEPQECIVEPSLSAKLDNLQLSTTVDAADDTTIDTVPIAHRPGSIRSDVSDEEYEHDWSSGESYDSRSGDHHMSRREIRLYEEQRALERQEPIQAHLENLHHAFWNVDPDYTVFAFGGTISRGEVDIRQMALRVWKSTPDACETIGPAEDDKKEEETEKNEVESTGCAELESSRGPHDSEFSFPLMGTDVDNLLKFASIAPYGKGTETVVDYLYRKAMEITPDRFELKLDPILGNGDILDHIAKTLHMNCRLRAEIAKLNIYTKGGFFRKHCDTPRSSEHIGTIVLGLPGAYKGGTLSVKHGGPAVSFDWGTPYGEKELVPMTELKWAFLYGDCEHEVQWVYEGARCTVAYDVFRMSDTHATGARDQTASDAIYDALRQAMQDGEGFAKDGCTLAFGLSHSYPQTMEPLWKGLEGRLKGADAVLLQAVTRCGLSYSFKAAFERPENENGWWSEGQEWGKAQCDNLSDTTLNAIYRNGLERFRVILTDKPDALEGCFRWGSGFGNQYFFERIDYDQPAIKQLVWVDLPQNYGFKNDYQFIGNGPCDPAEAYSGVVLLIEIPSAEER